jgi:hypothetical protein
MPRFVDSGAMSLPFGGNDIGVSTCSRASGWNLRAASLLHRLFHLRRGDVTDASGDRPTMTKRVFDLTVAVAPKHFRHRHGGLCTCLHRLRGEGVGVLDIEMDQDRGALKRFWAECAMFRHLVDQHHHGITDTDTGMHEPPVRAALLKSIARGRAWLDEIVSGTTTIEDVAARHKCSVRHVNMTISMAFTAPALVKAAIEGRLPRGIGVAALRDPPAEWSLQFERLGLTQPI